MNSTHLNQSLVQAISKWPDDPTINPTNTQQQQLEHFKLSIPYQLNKHLYDNLNTSPLNTHNNIIPQKYIHLTFDSITLGLNDDTPTNQPTPQNHHWQAAIAYRYHTHPNNTISEAVIPYNLSHCLHNHNKPLNQKTFKSTERLLALCLALTAALGDQTIANARSIAPILIHVPHPALCSAINQTLAAGLANYAIQRSSTIIHKHPAIITALERVIHFTQALPILSVQFIPQANTKKIVKSQTDKATFARLANLIPNLYLNNKPKINPKTINFKTINQHVNHELQKIYPSFFPYYKSSTLRNKPFKPRFTTSPTPKVTTPKKT